MGSQEWDGVSNFLRQVYSTGDDMKDMAAGVASADNQKRALDDIEQLRKYSRAADVSVNKKDGPGVVAICDKMFDLVGDLRFVKVEDLLFCVGGIFQVRFNFPKGLQLRGGFIHATSFA